MTESLPRFDGKVALITGASRGFGRALALALARQGAHIVAAARTKAALEELDDELKALGAEASLLRLDLRDGAQIDRLGPTLYQRWQRLDIFVGAAAILTPLTPLGHMSEADWTQTLAVNLTANWRLVRTLDPLLRLAPAARALFITCAAAVDCRAYWGAYAASKAALEALAKIYAEEVRSTPVRLNLFDPGPMRTRIRRQAFPGENEAEVTSPEAISPAALALLTETVTASGERFCFDGPRPIHDGKSA